ncbi:hypothetical protein AWB85_13525 [Mycobacteroides immunogenum]|uniref:Uncharacterized protein n=1 Tax=Mycobacteroides immunogenum TaxID=83262 RepID=A0A179VA49_9MYCO|nr:DUF1883 domain-containing protein [Mycobacteroides immunogenum]OAT67176.1 hypothetical protein AWB85_13525 [Mycobacteroides immunogenum]
MKVPYMNLGQQPAGTVVEVIMQGGEAFVEVLDENNLGLLTDGQVHTYFGGPINGTFQCTLPTTGIWYVLGVSTAGPTQAQIFTTAPTPNSAPLPWAQDAQPIELQNGEVPDGTATATDQPQAPTEPLPPLSSDQQPSTLAAEFRGVVVGRLNLERAPSAEGIGLIAADDLMPVGPTFGSGSTTFATGDAVFTSQGVAPFMGTINWPATGDDLVTFSGPTKATAYPSKFGGTRVLAASGSQIAGRDLFIGQEEKGGDTELFTVLKTRVIDIATGQDVLNLPPEYYDLSAAQGNDGKIYAVGAGPGGRQLWTFNSYEDFVDPGKWSGGQAIQQAGVGRTQIIQLLGHDGTPYWALFESYGDADGSANGLIYRTAANPEALPTAIPHMLLRGDQPNMTLVDEGPLGKNPHGLSDTDARPNLPGIPKTEGWLPANYGPAVHQLSNGEIVLLVSQWVHTTPGEAIDKNLYRIVQYKINQQ